MSSDKKQNLQDTFLNAVRKSKTPLTIFLVNGVKLQGVVTWFDNFCVLLRGDGRPPQLVYKHAISTIPPSPPLQLFPDQHTYNPSTHPPFFFLHPLFPQISFSLRKSSLRKEKKRRVEGKSELPSFSFFYLLNGKMVSRDPSRRIMTRRAII